MNVSGTNTGLEFWNNTIRPFVSLLQKIPPPPNRRLYPPGKDGDELYKSHLRNYASLIKFGGLFNIYVAAANAKVGVTAVGGEQAFGEFGEDVRYLFNKWVYGDDVKWEGIGSSEPVPIEPPPGSRG